MISIEKQSKIKITDEAKLAIRFLNTRRYGIKQFVKCINLNMKDVTDDDVLLIELERNLKKSILNIYIYNPETNKKKFCSEFILIIEHVILSKIKFIYNDSIKGILKQPDEFIKILFDDLVPCFKHKPHEVLIYTYNYGLTIQAKDSKGNRVFTSNLNFKKILP
jgi:hypothetical protein